MNRRVITLLTLIFILTITVKVFLRQNIATDYGYVQIQEGISAVVFNDIDEQFHIEGTNRPARLPAGIYMVDSWTLERTDKNGVIWRLIAKDISNKKTFKVVKDIETILQIGEPIVSTLTVRKKDSEFHFHHQIIGPSRGEIKLIKNQLRTDPPKLLIRNQDGSYQESLTFQYG